MPTGELRRALSVCEGALKAHLAIYPEGSMKRRVLIVLACLALVVAIVSFALASPKATHAAVGVGSGGGTPGTSSNFTLVGHNALFDRGMNAALAVFDHFVYVGNR